MRTIACVLALALSGLAAAFAASPAAAQVTILFNSYEPPGGGNRLVAEQWAKDVERVTEGRVKVQFPPASLAPPNQQWQAVVQGVADAAYTFHAWLHNQLLLPRIAELPFVSDSAEATAVALWRTHEKYFAAANEYKDVVLLGYCAASPDQIFSLSSKPINSQADLKNLKVAVTPVSAERFKALGAVPVVAPAVQFYDVVSKGIVDATGSIGLSTVKFVNITSYIKAVTLLPAATNMATFSFFISKSKWAEIPEKDQALVRSVSGEHLAHNCGLWDRLDVESLNELKSRNIPIVEASPEFVQSMKQAWAPYEAEWLGLAAKRHVDGKAALAYFREQVAAVGKQKK